MRDKIWDLGSGMDPFYWSTCCRTDRIQPSTDELICFSPSVWLKLQRSTMTYMSEKTSKSCALRRVCPRCRSRKEATGTIHQESTRSVRPRQRTRASEGTSVDWMVPLRVPAKSLGRAQSPKSRYRLLVPGLKWRITYITQSQILLPSSSALCACHKTVSALYTLFVAHNNNPDSTPFNAH